jgi:hypothetical protein
VFAITRMTGSGRGSGVPIDELGAALYRLRDGLIEHARFLDHSREEALAELRAQPSR